MSIDFTAENTPTEDEANRAALTELAFKALDTLSEEAPEARLGDAVLLFEVLIPDQDGETTTCVWQKCSTPRAVVAAGLCALGTALNTKGERADD